MGAIRSRNGLIFMRRQYENAASVAQALSHHPQMTLPDLASIYTIIGVADTKLRRPEQARAVFQEAATSAPGQEEFWLNLTRELMELNRFADSIAAAHEGLKSDPKVLCPPLTLRRCLPFFCRRLCRSGKVVSRSGKRR